MGVPMIGRLVYLYMGSADVAADLEFYTSTLGGEVVWRVTSGDHTNAAVRLGEGPLVVLADHREARTVRHIWAVDDIDATVARLKSAGWAGADAPLELPDGPCLLLADPSGNELGLLHETRPAAL